MYVFFRFLRLNVGRLSFFVYLCSGPVEVFLYAEHPMGTEMAILRSDYTRV